MSDLALSRRRGVPWLFVALAVSLVVNAFFIGVIATDAFRLPAGKRPLNFELRWLQERLPEAEFASVLAAVEASRPAAEDHFGRLRTLRHELGVLVAAPTPDRTAIDAKLDAIRDEQRALIGALQATIVDAVLMLPAESRRGLAAAVVETRH